MGDGVYETIRMAGGHPFRFADHLARLKNSLVALEIPEPLYLLDLEHIIMDVARANHAQAGLARITITRGVSVDLYHPVESLPTVLAHLRPLPQLSPEERSLGARVTIVSRVRNMTGSTDPSIKTTSYLNSIQARREAESHGCREGLMLNHAGHVAEGASSSIFWVRNGELRTPSLEVGILPGITRQHTLLDARAAGIPTREGSWGPDDLLGAEEAFLTSSAVGILPIGWIDDTRKEPGAVTSALRARFGHSLAALEAPQSP